MFGSGSGDFDNLFDEIAKDAVGTQVEEVKEVPKEKPKKLVTPVEEADDTSSDDETDAELEAPEDEVEDSAEEDDAEEAEPVELPEGMVAVPAITDKMVTEFVIRDNEGEEVETPALVIEYKANGKVRKDRIDQVVKLAQFGVYNQEREQALVAKQDEAEQAVQEAMGQLEMREEQLRQLLEDEDAYLRVRERYMSENQPEKRARRAESEASELRTQRESERQAVQAERFYNQNIIPALSEIADKFPEVGIDEISAQLGTALVPVMRNGLVPPAMYPQVEQYIATVLAEWAESKHSSRVARYNGEKTKANKEVEAAKIAAAKAKRSAASAARPAVRSSSSASSKKSTKSTPATLAEAESAAMEEILSSLR